VACEIREKAAGAAALPDSSKSIEQLTKQAKTAETAICGAGARRRFSAKGVRIQKS
jgi:hypothetical protein